MKLWISPQGGIRCLYGEQIALRQFGAVRMRRASHVEPTADGRWQADLSLVGGPVLGPFELRSEALRAEVDWIEAAGLSALAEYVAGKSGD